MKFHRNYNDRTNSATNFSPHFNPRPQSSKSNSTTSFSPHSPEYISRSNKKPSQKSSSYSNLYFIPSKRKKKHRRSSNNSDRKSSSSSSHSSNSRVNISSYEVLDTVGCGSFARVSRVRRKSTKEILVWKELSYGVMNDKEKQMLCDEVNILRDLSHPNIVKFVDRLIDHANRKIYIVQEYCDGGDLASYIKLKKDKIPKMSGRISESFIWSVTSEISSALQHCHNHFNRNKDMKKRILHRDLKPGNVFLVKRRGSYSVKLGDFGLAKMLDESSVFAQTHVGTPYYMSPEQIQSKSYNEKSDIWSLGCIVYEMAMLSPPFKAANYWQLAEKIKLGTYKKVTTRNYSNELQNAISMMIKVDSKKRARVEDLLCLQKIQYTLKILRLDRRYCQLKKKEYAFNLKMKLLEDRYKKKSLALIEKENELLLKETELKQKEESLLTHSSPLVSTKSSNSTKSNNSISSNSTKSSNLSSNYHSSNNSNSNSNSNHSGSFLPISPVITSSYSFITNNNQKKQRTNSINSINSTNSFQSIREKYETKEESQTNSADELCNDHDWRGFSPHLSTKIQGGTNNIIGSIDMSNMSNLINLDRNNSNMSNLSSVSEISSGGTTNKDDIQNTPPNKICLMEKINLEDLNGNIIQNC